jgi:hypothetical protein
LLKENESYLDKINDLIQGMDTGLLKIELQEMDPENFVFPDTISDEIKSKIIEDLKINSIIKKKDLAFKKPGTGIRALYYKSVIGKKLKRNIKKDAIFKNLDFYEN